jgi:hypothetical protein
MRRILALLVLLASILTAAPATLAQAAPSACQFRLGFAALDALIRTPVGACLEDENHNPKNGDGLQHTTGGLMVWRKSDNWTAFTDGYHTWINGPNGLQERLNDQLFVWEKAEQAQAPTSTLLDQSGTGQATTDIFNPKGSFAVAYSFDCTSRGEGIFQITSRVPNNGPIADLGDAPDAVKGQGTFHFTTAGPHVLKILTYDGCLWHVTVTG